MWKVLDLVHCAACRISDMSTPRSFAAVVAAARVECAVNCEMSMCAAVSVALTQRASVSFDAGRNGFLHVRKSVLSCSVRRVLVRVTYLVMP